MYQPISCDLYDELLQMATLKQALTLLYDKDGAIEEKRGYIKDIFTKEKVEYLLLDDGFQIPLDQIRSANGISFDKTACSWVKNK